MSQRVLIVDDDPAQRRILEETIKRFGYQTLTAQSGEEALEKLEADRSNTISLMVLDLVMPGLDGMAVLAELRQRKIFRPVIVQTAHGSIETAIKAMRAGAGDFVIKPVAPERLQVSLQNALKMTQLEGEITRIKRKVSGNFTFKDLITKAPVMERVMALGSKAAGSNIPVLIEGESGVGKELIARAIQGQSDRAGKSFVTVNCGAIPENLVESILFGHEKGAFTGATEKRVGKFVEADGGTLFLDEVGELPLDVQVKLLRALQDGEIDPVGAKKPIKVDIRLISATNQDMIARVKEGKFREDLFYRLNVFPVMVPPLRDRLEDVPHLVRHFVTHFAAEEGKRIENVSDEAMDMLQRYPWPGNVRQLENTVFRAVVLSDAEVLAVSEFPQIATHVEGFDAEPPKAPEPSSKDPAYSGPAMIGGHENQAPVPLTSDTAGGGTAMGITVFTEDGDIRPLRDIEEDMIRLAAARYRGRMTEIAQKLCIGRSTLYRKMRKLGLEAT